MYQNVMPLSQETHANKRFRPLSDYHFARNQVVIPIAANELTRVAGRVPIGLIESEQEGLRPMALLGVDGSTNLLVGPDGRWLQDYVPAAIRRYPFILARREGQEGEEAQSLVGIDQAADALSDTEGEPLFTDAGEPGERLAGIMELLRQLDLGVRAMGAAAENLRAAGVVEDWTPAIEVGGKRQRLAGLKRVSEEALNGLDDQAFAGLRQGGALGLAYAQMLSMAQLPRLVRLAEARHNAAERAAKQGRGDGRGGTDELSFNFDA